MLSPPEIGTIGQLSPMMSGICRKVSTFQILNKEKALLGILFIHYRTNLKMEEPYSCVSRKYEDCIKVIIRE